MKKNFRFFVGILIIFGVFTFCIFLYFIIKRKKRKNSPMIWTDQSAKSSFNVAGKWQLCKLGICKLDGFVHSFHQKIRFWNFTNIFTKIFYDVTIYSGSSWKWFWKWLRILMTSSLLFWNNSIRNWLLVRWWRHRCLTFNLFLNKIFFFEYQQVFLSFEINWFLILNFKFVFWVNFVLFKSLCI